MSDFDKFAILTEVLNLPPSTDKLAQLVVELANSVASFSKKNSEETGVLLETLQGINKDMNYIREKMQYLQKKVEGLSDRTDALWSQVTTKH